VEGRQSGGKLAASNNLMEPNMRYCVSTATSGIRVVLFDPFWQEEGELVRSHWVVMAQYFLFSAAARPLSAAKIMRMSEQGVANVFLRLR
jgi:hypothetical protein